MIQTAHLGESSAQHPSLVLDAPIPRHAYHSGFLGDRHAQTPTATTESDIDDLWLLVALTARFAAVGPEPRLAVLKRHKFAPEGREHRIKVSLDALEGDQPIILTRDQWKEIVEEVEDED